jgi:hypothetical protein
MAVGSDQTRLTGPEVTKELAVGDDAPSIYHLRGDKSDKSGAIMVRSDRKMREVVITDRGMAAGDQSALAG